MSFFHRLKPARKQFIPDLERRIAYFREILHANNTALGFIAEIQEAMESTDHLTATGASRMITGVTVQTFRMISNLMRMSGDKKYTTLVDLFNALKTEIAHKIQLTPVLKPVGFVLPLVEVGPNLAESVGMKSAYLGEARRILHGHVPGGFATTVESYSAFMAGNGLGARISSLMEELRAGDIVSRFEISARIVQMIESAHVPDEVARAIDTAVAALPGGMDLRLAVRSSALQEGGLEISFAGQYRSMLNIRRDGVVDAFRRVVASKYSPQAITYRIERGFSDSEVAMCCCVQTMVNAAAAGVLYTLVPHSSGARTIVQAVRGLGLSAVDGSAEPDTITLDRSSHKVMETNVGLQTAELRMAAMEGTERVPIGKEAASTPAITAHQALLVAELAWKMEKELRMPLDVEWAIDPQGRAFILQARPISSLPNPFEKPRKTIVSGALVLLERGTRVSGGAASGPVCLIEKDLDILKCRPGSVITIHEANPRFAVLLPRAAAVLADMGEFTGHLATVARELQVPALFATRHASKYLKQGEIVTVDADAGVVYGGRIDSVLSSEPQNILPRDSSRELLKLVAPLIIPLTMKERYSSGYSPRKCKTIHDIIRVCHQATIEEMFELGDKNLYRNRPLRRLISPVPIDCRILDLGGGLKADAGDRVVPEDVVCRPMRALWKGMTHPRLHWRQTRAISLRGFMSAVVDYSFDLDARLRPMGEPSYVFVTVDYMNLNSRIGYHFSTVDARICDTIELNYASFRFVGGATGIEQRSRRALLIEQLLAAGGFETDRRSDLVNARIRHRPPEEMNEALFKVGLLIGYVNHLDMALVSDQVMKEYRDAFLAGNYEFKA
jgi:pyruvate,water dikinase